jgi:hypothetical protein
MVNCLKPQGLLSSGSTICGPVRRARVLPFDYLSKCNIMLIKILDAKLLDSIRFEFHPVVDPGTALFIFSIKSFDVFHPKVSIPHLLDDTPVRNKLRFGGCLTEHDGLSIASYHAETWWFTPQSIVGETQLISKVICRRDYIPNKQDRGYSLNLRHTGLPRL